MYKCDLNYFERDSMYNYINNTLLSVKPDTNAETRGQVNMTQADKLRKIEKAQDELRKMYDDGDFGELLQSDLTQEQFEFLIKLKDFYRGQDQKKIINKDFVI